MRLEWEPRGGEKTGQGMCLVRAQPGLGDSALVATNWSTSETNMVLHLKNYQI